MEVNRIFRNSFGSFPIFFEDYPKSIWYRI
jgi:hypothetical protein